MSTDAKKVPTDTVLEGEVVPPAKPSQESTERTGTFAQITTEKDKEKVEEVYDVLKPYLRVAAKVAIFTVAPEAYTAMAIKEGIQTGRRLYNDRKVRKTIEAATPSA